MRHRRFLLALAIAGCAHGPPPPAPPFESGPSPGCGKTGPTGVLLDQRIVVDGTERSYVLSVPEPYDPNRPLPLLFGWHGQSWNGANYRSNGSGVENASNGGAIFVYADGEPRGPRSGWDLDVGDDDVALFDALLQSVADRYCVERGRVFSFGHSFGGYFTHTLACARGDRIAGVAAVIGGIAGDGCTQPVPAFITHNQDDPIVPFSSAVEARERYLALAGCSTSNPEPVEPSPCVSYQGCRQGVQVVWCENATGGHEPPGYAGAAIWSFFGGLPSR